MLPDVMYVKTGNNWVIKFALTDKFLDCSSKDFCYVVTREGKYQRIRGLYYIPADPVLTVKTWRRELINELLKNLPKIPNTIVTVNNFNIKVYNIYKKAVNIYFPFEESQGHLEVYRVDPLDSLQLYNSIVENLMAFPVYNHIVQLRDQCEVITPRYVSGGFAKIIRCYKDTELVSESQDHDTLKLTLLANRYYMLVHPRPQD